MNTGMTLATYTCEQIAVGLRVYQCVGCLFLKYVQLLKSKYVPAVLSNVTVNLVQKSLDFPESVMEKKDLQITAKIPRQSNDGWQWLGH